MTEETNVAPGEATEITSPVEAETPEITAPETEKTEQPAETEAEKEAKAIKALQRRIDKRTRDLYAERAQRERLEQEVAALRQPKDPAETPEVDVEALAAQKAEQIAEQRELARKVNDTLSKGKALEGFDAACNAAIEELGLLNPKGQPTPLLKVFLEADAPHEVLYHIGRNPDVASEFEGLTPTQAARRIVKLEAEIAKAKAPQVSTAPKPLSPITPTAKTEGYSPGMSDKEFAEMRRRQIAARRA